LTVTISRALSRPGLSTSQTTGSIGIYSISLLSVAESINKQEQIFLQDIKIRLKLLDTAN
jgi:hypothetical protein